MSGPRQSGLLVLALRWLMWNRRRAVIVLAVAFIAIVAAARILASLNAPASPPAAPPAAASSATTSPSAANCPPRSEPPAKLTPVKAAVEFAGRWADHDVNPPCWQAALQPWSTDAYGQQVLPTVDPSTVPANRITGPARLINQQGRAAEVAVPLDGLTIRVSLLDVSGLGAWRVNDLTSDTPGGNP